MPDLGNFPILDVAIGLFVLFFVLATAASALNEAVASALAWRAQNLENAIRVLLADPRREGGSELTKWIYAHWRIQGLFRKPYLKSPGDPQAPPRRKPSYVPPRTFALALVDTL